MIHHIGISVKNNRCCVHVMHLEPVLWKWHKIDLLCLAGERNDENMCGLFCSIYVNTSQLDDPVRLRVHDGLLIVIGTC